jgi:hypothetical protein
MESVVRNKQLTLSWKSGLAIFFGSILIGLLFFHFGRLALARPTIFSVIVIATVFTVRWKQRHHVWFWVTMTIFSGLHVLLILSIPWTTRWVPAIVLAPIGLVDFYVMLVVLSAVGKFAERATTSET